MRPNEDADWSSEPRRAVPVGPNLKKAVPEDASGKHRQRKEERRAQPETSLRRGRDEALAPQDRQPSQVLALASLRSGPRWKNSSAASIKKPERTAPA